MGNLSVSIPLDTANYYRSLPLPVLLVRYSSHDDAIYARWFHQFDPYYGGVGEKTLTFRWGEEDVLSSSSDVDGLAAEARAFLRLRSSSLPLPLRVELDVPAGGSHDLTDHQIRAGLREAIRGLPEVLALGSGEPKPGSVRVVVGPDALQVNMAEVTTATAHLTDYAPNPERIGADAVVMIGLAFEHVGQSDLAGRIAYRLLAQSSFVAAPEVAWALSSAMSRTRRIRESLELSNLLDQEHSDAHSTASTLFTLCAIQHAGSLDESEKDAFAATMEARIERRREWGDEPDAGRSCYTLGAFFRRQAEPEESVRWYEEALAGDPGYADRDYYWQDLGGVLFGSHRYPESVTAYDRARELGAEGLVEALAADATMFAGRYEEARDRFQEYLEKNADSQSEYRLKAVFLDALVEQFGIPIQTRDSSEAQKALWRIDADAAGDDRAMLLSEVLGMDSLNGAAWGGLGLVHAELGKGEAALLDFLAASLCLEGDAAAWVSCLLMALDIRQDLAQDIVRTAGRLARGAFRRAIAEWAAIDDLPIDGDELVKFVDAVLDSQGEPDDGSFLLRFVDSESIREVKVPGVGGSY